MRKLYIAALVLAIVIALIGVLGIVRGVEEHNNRLLLDEKTGPRTTWARVEARGFGFSSAPDWAGHA